jgi:hypothetical protein
MSEAEVDRIMAMTDAQILAECRASGEDPAKTAADGRRMLRRVLWGKHPSLFCRLGKCRQCAHYEDADGMGGKCVNCGKVHGWITRETLRRYADTAIARAES